MKTIYLRPFLVPDEVEKNIEGFSIWEMLQCGRTHKIGRFLKDIIKICVPDPLANFINVSSIVRSTSESDPGISNTKHTSINQLHSPWMCQLQICQEPFEPSEIPKEIQNSRKLEDFFKLPKFISINCQIIIWHTHAKPQMLQITRPHFLFQFYSLFDDLDD